MLDDGAMILPTVGALDPTITDRDAFTGHQRRSRSARCSDRGVGQQPALFTADMLAFHRSWSARIEAAQRSAAAASTAK